MVCPPGNRPQATGPGVPWRSPDQVRSASVASTISEWHHVLLRVALGCCQPEGLHSWCAAAAVRAEGCHGSLCWGRIATCRCFNWAMAVLYMCVGRGFTGTCGSTTWRQRCTRRFWRCGAGSAAVLWLSGRRAVQSTPPPGSPGSSSRQPCRRSQAAPLQSSSQAAAPPSPHRPPATGETVSRSLSWHWHLPHGRHGTPDWIGPHQICMVIRIRCAGCDPPSRSVARYKHEEVHDTASLVAIATFDEFRRCRDPDPCKSSMHPPEYQRSLQVGRNVIAVLTTSSRDHACT